MAKKKTPFGNIKKGALHKQLGYKLSDKIPKSVLNKIIKAKIGDVLIINGKKIKITGLLKKRVNFALNFGRG